jgi:hypothetical protein
MIDFGFAEAIYRIYLNTIYKEILTFRL